MLVAGWGVYAVQQPGSDPVENFNALQILENRIAPQPAALKLFYSRGLPRSPVIAAERGNFPGGTSPLYADQRLMAWIDH